MTQTRFSPLALAWLAVITAAAFASSFIAPQLMPFNVLALAAVALCLYWGIRWQPAVLIWLWVLSFGMLDGYFWRLRLTGFFNLTIPRILFLVALLVALVHLISRRRLRFDRGIFGVMFVFIVYIAIRATASGWVNPPDEDQPYFKFLGALLFPFVAFYLMYSSFRDGRSYRLVLLLSAVYGLYALFIAYCQIFDLRHLIWPSYINDPTVGIHFDRARGPFGETYPQVVFLVFLFYANLFLLPRAGKLVKPLLWLEIVAIPPALFFAHTRSGWLAFLICGLIYLRTISPRPLRGVKFASAIVIAFVLAVVFWQNISSTDRSQGGWGSLGELRSRALLARQTVDMAVDSPLIGVGWGKFLQAQRHLQMDPASYEYRIPGWRLPEHNAFLNMLAETGIIGLALYVAIFILLMRQSLQLWRRLPETHHEFVGRAIVGLFWVMLATYLTDAMFRDTLWEEFSNALFWSFSGLIVGLNRVLQPAPLHTPVVTQMYAKR